MPREKHTHSCEKHWSNDCKHFSFLTKRSRVSVKNGEDQYFNSSSESKSTRFCCLNVKRL